MALHPHVAIAQEVYIHGFPMVMNDKTPYNDAIDTQNFELRSKSRRLIKQRKNHPRPLKNSQPMEAAMKQHALSDTN